MMPHRKSVSPGMQRLCSEHMKQECVPQHVFASCEQYMDVYISMLCALVSFTPVETRHGIRSCTSSSIFKPHLLLRSKQVRVYIARWPAVMEHHTNSSNKRMHDRTHVRARARTHTHTHTHKHARTHARSSRDRVGIDAIRESIYEMVKPAFEQQPD
jgi:hypothetical protein